MSSNWTTCKLIDVSTYISRGITPSYTETGGMRILNQKCIRNGEINLEPSRFNDPNKKKVPEEKQLKRFDILINSTGQGTLGRVAQVKVNQEAMTFDSHITTLRPNSKIVNPIYLGFVLRNLQPVIENLAEGSTGQTELSRTKLGELVIELPPLSAQEKAAETLSALDDRITLLRETNATLEAIAQALFKSWFVDFDPVRAKVEGREPEGMPAEVADLFPSEFEETELGEIPKGWSFEPLRDVLEFKEGPGIRNWQYTNSDIGTRFINIRCIQNGDLSIGTASRITEEEANGKYAHFHLKSWDVVVSTSGTLGRSAIVRKEHLPLMLNTSVIRFRPVENKMVFTYLYLFLNTSTFLNELNAMATGSVQKNFGPMHLNQMNMLTPHFKVLQSFEGVVRPLYEKIVENRSSAECLTELRDTLLPRLMSGKLRIPDLEEEAA